MEKLYSVSKKQDLELIVAQITSLFENSGQIEESRENH